MYKTKEDAIVHLIQNSSYDSDWVNIAADLLSQAMLNSDGSLGEFRETDLVTLNAKQLSIVSDAVKANQNLKEAQQQEKGKFRLIPIKDLIYAGLNATQMEILKVAFAKKELSEDRYYILKGMIDKTIPYAKLNFLVQGVVEGFPEIMNYKDFDAAQIVEIYSGWKDGIDYTIYAKSYINADDMAIMRHAMVVGRTVVITAENSVTTINEKEKRAETSILGYRYEIQK